MIEVRSQAELDQALANQKPGELIACVGDGRFSVGGSAHVMAWGSSHVEARESSHVEAWGSSHVVAWGSSHVEARESSHVVAWGSSHVEASKWASVLPGNGRYDKPTITGGVILERPVIDSAEVWCEYHGVPIRDDGTVVLFKAVDDDYVSSRNFAYLPGTTPEAADWDPEPECGGGLHFAASVGAAIGFNPDATRFVACPVALDEIVVHPDATYPQKVKAPRVAAPCWEVTRHGEAVTA